MKQLGLQHAVSAEVRQLREVCQALFPAVDVEALGVPEAAANAVRQQDAVQQRQFYVLLRALDCRLVNWLLTGKARRFGDLSQREKEGLLCRLATSRWGFSRRWFQAIKRLAAFYTYALADPEGVNPSWPRMGYRPPPPFPATAEALPVETIARPATMECDVCVIGSGAGGGVVAAEMAHAGKSVIVLEAGGGWQAADYPQREQAGFEQLYLDHGRTTSDDLGVTVLAGSTLGGGTAVNWQTCLALPPAIRDEWAEVSGCRHFIEESFTRAIEAVSQRLHVGTAETSINRNNDALRRGCEKLGYRWTLLPRNARHCDAEQCGFCVFGCRHGGKQSTPLTFLDDAQKTGRTRIIVHCRAERVRIEGGKVTGVVASGLDPASGERHDVEVRSRQVAVAAGALHSPAVLLRSGLKLPALGRNLFLHPTAAVAGAYPEPVAPWSGPPQSVLCDEFAYLEGNYGFRLETAPVHPGAMAQAAPWTSAREHRRLMEQAGNTSAIIALARDRSGGRVTLGEGGRPVIHYRPGQQEMAHLKQGMAAAARIHLAAGAREVLTMHTRGLHLIVAREQSPRTVDEFCRRIERQAIDDNWCMLYSAHQMGTCRMGRCPKTAVCDASGQVFGVRGLFIADASAFPASSGVNPMISIMALAHHVARQIIAVS